MLPHTFPGWVFAISIMTMVLMAGVGVGIALDNIGSPLEVLSQEDVGRIAQHDDRIWIRYRVNRSRACLADNSHFLITNLPIDGHPTTVVIPVTQDGPVPFENLGITEYVLSLQRPPGLFPGNWSFITKTEDRCGPFGPVWPHRSQSKPLPINIEETRATPGTPVTTRHPDGSTTERSRSPLTPAVKP
jgi:hypothetical protein